MEARGLGGRLFTRALGFGGAGKFAMLEGFRIALPGVGKADNGDVDAELSFDMCVVLRVGTTGVD